MENELKEISEKAERNYNLIKDNTTKINENLEKIEQNSFALNLLKELNKDGQRWYKAFKCTLIVLIIVVVLWGATVAYLVYTLNDIGTIEETTTQEVSDIETINGNVVNNGDVYGES